MRLPIKLNRASLPAWARRLPIACDDPRALVTGKALAPEAFSRHVSVLKFGSTFKTTHPGRHAHSNALVGSIFANQHPVVLDVGASDGSTSLDLIRALGAGFSRYFVTDFNIRIQFGENRRGATFFRDPDGHILLRASDEAVVYSDVAGAPDPIGRIARFLLRGAATVDAWSDFTLMQPELLGLAAKDPRITIERYDVLRPWQGPRPDLVKVANVLNRAYFPEALIARALRQLGEALSDGGRLLLLDNRGDEERFTLLRKAGLALQVERERLGGCDVAPLVSAAR